MTYIGFVAVTTDKTMHVGSPYPSSDQNLRGPHVARQQQLSINICRRPAPDLSSKPAPPPLLLSIDGKDRRTDGHSTVL